MPARALRREAAALLGYVCVALVFAWPLPLRLADALLGLPNGDAGVYVWNLWVFRHEIVANHRLPFLTSEILALSPPVPLALHNYTTFANILAFPLIPLIGVVRTFNVLVLASGVMSGYAMYLYARMRTGDARGGVAGRPAVRILSVHERARGRAFQPDARRAAADFRLADVPDLLAADDGPCVRGRRDGGVGVSLRRLLRRLLPADGPDSWRATRCSASRRGRRPSAASGRARSSISAIVCLVGLIVGMLLRGGGQVDVFGIRVSFTRLYTPVLMLTLMIAVRIWMTIRPRVVTVLPLLAHAPTAAVGLLVCVAILSPLLSVTTSSLRTARLDQP